jgi:major vault protein
MQNCTVVRQGYYAILTNPSKEQGQVPKVGSVSSTPELLEGERVVVSGPTSFALWPQQSVEVRRGHRLGLDDYLLIEVRDVNRAKKEWSSATVEAAQPQGQEEGDDEETLDEIAGLDEPDNMTRGKRFVVPGNKVSYFEPPSGIEVVPVGDSQSPDGFVAKALTLEQLEYCILVSQDGKKRFVKGPSVVFPEPTESFVTGPDEKGKQQSKFRAIELNELSGIHLRALEDVTLGGKAYKGETEIFLKGQDVPIFFPDDKTAFISYDGRIKHFATAVPPGKGVYVMNRLNAEIDTRVGPQAVLPDPRNEVIVRRPLSDRECSLWYPGNHDALIYNQQLRGIMANVPTTRQGAISEGDFMRAAGGKKSRKVKDIDYGLGSGEADINYLSYSSASVGAQAPTAVRDTTMSRSHGDQARINKGTGLPAGEAIERSATYTAPRTIQFDRFSGAPTIDVWQNYAIQVVTRADNGEEDTRMVLIGPTTHVMGYDQILQALSLSRGKPKTTDDILDTAYLKIRNNKVGDIIRVTTKDHVTVDVKVSHRVNFEGPEDKWFGVDNYVKFLCDHARSLLRAAVRKMSIEEFYANAEDIVRDVLLGQKPAALEDGTLQERPGLPFSENGMRVDDVEVLAVTIQDQEIANILVDAQRRVVRDTVNVQNSERNLGIQARLNVVTRELRDEEHKTFLHDIALKEGKALEEHENRMKRLVEAQLRGQREAEGHMQRVLAELGREAKGFEADLAQRRNNLVLATEEQAAQLEAVQATTDAVVKQFEAVQPQLVSAINAASHQDFLRELISKASVIPFGAGESVVDAAQKVLGGNLMATALPNLGGSDKTSEEEGTNGRNR